MGVAKRVLCSHFPELNRSKSEAATLIDHTHAHWQVGALSQLELLWLTNVKPLWLVILRVQRT